VLHRFHIRWTIVGLFVVAMVINYLARSVLGVASPAVMTEQHISAEQYSWITGAFQVGIMFQPVAGYLLAALG
jgi:ACS family hexuronate transporter-like MFS transporter